MVAVARLSGVFGVRGELKCHPLAGATVEAGRDYALDAAGERTIRCRAVRRHQSRLLVALEGVESREAAAVLANTTLYGDRSAIVLAENEYLDRDLIGLRLIDIAGTVLGEVVAIEHYPAQDYLVVGPQRALVPMVGAFLKKIDLDAKTILVDLPEGLISGEPL